MIRESIYKLLMMVVLAAGIISCSSDSDAPADTVSVNISATIADDGTFRGYGEELQVNSLIVGIFDAQMNEIGRQGFPVTGTSISASVNLVMGQTYNLVLWAQNSACPIYDITDLKAIKMNAFPSKITFAQAEQSDAFCAVVTNVVVNGNSSLPVTLTRPMAQVNLGNLGAAQQTKFTLKSVYTTYHPFSKMASGQSDISWDFSEVSTEQFIFNGTSYNYLALGYLFAPVTDPIYVDGEVVLTGQAGSQTNSISGIALQANWKTNIGGTFSRY